MSSLYSARFGDRVLFEDLELTLGDELVGLTGPNGSGKSTLARMLDGVYVAQDDDAPNFAALAGVERELRALRRLSVGAGSAEDAGLVTDWTLEDRLSSALAALGLCFDPLRDLDTVSGGERVRARLAAARLCHERLVLDEPTNHLDREARAQVIAWLRSLAGALVVSHDREVLAACDRVLELRAGRLLPWGQYQRERERNARDLEVARREARRVRVEAQRARERQARSDARGKRSRSSGSFSRSALGQRKEQAQVSAARRSGDHERKTGEASARLSSARACIARELDLGFVFRGARLAEGRVAVELVGARVDGVFDEVELRVTGPRRVAITGPSGAGKTTLLRVIAGTRALDAGSRRALPVTWLDQSLSVPLPEASVLENLRAARPELAVGPCRELLAGFGFQREDIHKTVSVLSGGERLRCALAMTLRRETELLLLDEPTNHLDLDATEVLVQAILSFPGALVVVSHDEAFLEALALDARLVLP